MAMTWLMASDVLAKPCIASSDHQRRREYRLVSASTPTTTVAAARMPSARAADLIIAGFTLSGYQKPRRGHSYRTRFVSETAQYEPKCRSHRGGWHLRQHSPSLRQPGRRG